MSTPTSCTTKPMRVRGAATEAVGHGTREPGGDEPDDRRDRHRPAAPDRGRGRPDPPGRTRSAGCSRRWSCSRRRCCRRRRARRRSPAACACGRAAAAAGGWSPRARAISTNTGLSSTLRRTQYPMPMSTTLSRNGMRQPQVEERLAGRDGGHDSQHAPDASSRPSGTPIWGDGAEQAAPVDQGVLAGHEYRPAPLTAGRDALQDPQQHQQDRSRDPDLGVGRQEADERGRRPPSAPGSGRAPRAARTCRRGARRRTRRAGGRGS